MMEIQGDLLEDYWRRAPLSPFYNLHGLSDVILTCDVDWAPDYAIRDVIGAAARFGHKLTIFATHRSEVLLEAPGHVEVGLHPDFTRPHAKKWFDEKLARLKESYPQAVGCRSHRNFFGQNIGDLAKACGLIYDASTFLWNEPFCQAHIDYNGIVRFSYMWEDGIHLDMGLPLSWESISLHTPGLKIINVHPITIYLNCRSEDERRAVTSRYSDLTQAPREEIDLHRQSHAPGVRDLWIRLLTYLQENKVRTHHLGPLAERALRSAGGPDILSEFPRSR